VRVQQFVQAFGGNGIVYSICQDNYGPALNTIATKVAQTMTAPACVSLPSNGAEPKCTVIDRAPQASGPVDTPVPACAETGGDTPCWWLEPSGDCPGGQSRLVVNRGAVPVPDGLLMLVKCEP
jgi:hypothetical protein